MGPMYWLAKTEPSTYSIKDLKRDATNQWDGVRNYQARNFLQKMKKGDLVLIYHSNEKPVGVVGLGEVSKEAYPDWTQFEPKSEYFDPKASNENPRWFAPDISFREEFPRVVTLEEMKIDPKLKGLKILEVGNRLSIVPVSSEHFRRIVKRASG